MAIYIVTGRPRHGKTYFIIKSAVRWIKEGTRIYSNVYINLDSPLFKKYFKKNGIEPSEAIGDIDNPEDLKNPVKQVFYWKNIRDWNKMTSGIIIADEATRYFNPRRWSMLSEATENKLTQHGHEDLDIWATCQHYSRIDVTLRVLAENFYVVKKVFPFSVQRNNNFPWGIIRISEHFLEDMERLDRVVDLEERKLYTNYTNHILITPKYTKLYDTRQLIGKSENTDLYHEEQWCEYENCPQHGRVTGKPKIFHS